MVARWGIAMDGCVHTCTYVYMHIVHPASWIKIPVFSCGVIHTKYRIANAASTYRGK